MVFPKQQPGLFRKYSWHLILFFWILLPSCLYANQFILNHNQTPILKGDWSTIYQAAVNGDTIEVNADDYPAGFLVTANLLIQKDIHLNGRDSRFQFQGDNTNAPAIAVSGNAVNTVSIANISIRPVTDQKIGLYINAPSLAQITIENTIISGNFNAITVQDVRPNAAILFTHNVINSLTETKSIINRSSASIQAPYNYWGTPSLATITPLIDSTEPVQIMPYLLSPNLPNTISLKEGDWDDPAVWSNGVPKSDAIVEIRHLIHIRSASSPAIAQDIVLLPEGQLEIHSSATLSLGGDFSVWGKLELAPGSKLSFLHNTGLNHLWVMPTGFLKLSGALLQPAQLIGSQQSLYIEISGQFLATYFLIANTTGLILKESARVLNFKHGKISNIDAKSPFIDAETSFKGEEIEFEGMGRCNIKLTNSKSFLQAYLINCTRQNNLPDESSSQGKIIWKNSPYSTSLADPSVLSEIGSATSSAFGDLTHDGFPDLVICSAKGLFLLMNDQGKSFIDITDRVGIKMTQPIKQAILADYNQDGNIDLLLLTEDGKIQLWENTASQSDNTIPTFHNSSAKIMEFLTSRMTVKAMTYVMLSKSHLLDLVLLTDQGPMILTQTEFHAFVNNTDKFSQIASVYASDSQAQAKACYAYDLDHNGLSDIIVLFQDCIEIDYINSDFSITPIRYSKRDDLSVSDSSFLKSLSFSDLNNDGYLDIVGALPQGKLLILTNQNAVTKQSKSSFQVKTVYSAANSNAYFSDSDFVRQVEIIDLNHDGWMDILQPDSETVFQTRLGSEKGDYPTDTSLAWIHPLAPNSFSIADINQDGIPDICVTSKIHSPEIYWGRVAKNANELTVKFKQTPKTRLEGANVIISGDNFSRTQQIGLTNGYFAQSGQDLFFDLGNTTKINQLLVTFPSGKIYAQSNLFVSPTASILVDEDQARSAWVISGTVKNTATQKVATGSIELMNMDSGETISTVSICDGSYRLMIDATSNTLKLRASYESESKTYFIETQPRQILQDISLDFQFPNTNRVITGNVVYNQVPLKDITIQAIPLASNLSNTATRNIIQTQSDATGNYVFNLYDGNWMIQFWKNNQFLSNYSGIMAIPDTDKIATYDLKDVYPDTDPPSIILTNLTNTQVISGNFTLLGTIDDDIGIQNYEVAYRTSDTEQWTSVSQKTGKATGELASWNTIDLPDNTYQVKVSALDAAHKKTELIFSSIKIQNISSEIYKRSFSEGDYFISIPFQKDTSKTFRNFTSAEKWMRYAPTTNAYITPDSADFEPSFLPGIGYWLHVDKGTTTQMDLTGAQINTQNVTVKIQEGWNMIGNPFYYGILLSKIKFQYNNAIYSLDEAIQNGFIGRTFFSWVDADYQLFSSTSTLLPWSSIWLYATKSGDLIFQKGIVGSAKSTGLLTDYRAQTANTTNWQLRFLLKNSDRILDGSTLLGISQTAQDESDIQDMPKPPITPFGLSIPRVYFMMGTDKKTYAIDMRAPIQDHKTWNLAIDATHYLGDELSLELEPLNHIPDQFSVRLYNQITQEWVDIKNRKTYSFSTKTKGIYSFQIEVENDASILTNRLFELTNLTIFPNPFNPNSPADKQNKVRIRYDLSKPATGKLEIYALSGRLIHTEPITPDQYGLRQTNTITWDGMDSSGTLMPNDVYFLLIRLKDDSGNDVKAKGKIVLWKK